MVDHRFHYVRVLKLTRWGNVSMKSDDWTRIFTACVNLETLIIHGYDRNSFNLNNGLHNINNGKIVDSTPPHKVSKKVVKECRVPNLLIRIPRRITEGFDTNDTSNVQPRICKYNLPYLKFIEVLDWESSDITSLISLCHSSPNLETLNLNVSVKVRENDLIILFENCIGLRNLIVHCEVDYDDCEYGKRNSMDGRVNRTRGSIAHTISKYCGKLKNVEFSSSFASDAISSPILSLPLTMLKIRNTLVGIEPPPAPTTSVSFLGNINAFISSQTISANKQNDIFTKRTEISGSTLMEVSKLRMLTVLVIENVSAVSDSIIISICENCKLKQLELSYLDNFGDVGLRAIGKIVRRRKKSKLATVESGSLVKLELFECNGIRFIENLLFPDERSTVSKGKSKNWDVGGIVEENLIVQLDIRWCRNLSQRPSFLQRLETLSKEIEVKPRKIEVEGCPKLEESFIRRLLVSS
ncbi:hypothetical protein HK098_006970 [Nowakowskiella sp. JEL0407]|nr:hypothetical protein HK098_006970 [Nowakowskiella sp. JEL0407]